MRRPENLEPKKVISSQPDAVSRYGAEWYHSTWDEAKIALFDPMRLMGGFLAGGLIARSVKRRVIADELGEEGA